MRLRLSSLALAAVTVALGNISHAAPVQQRVTFETAPYRVAQIQQQQARERGKPAPSSPDIISGYLSKPDGDGPFPAVIYLHGCAGLSTSNRNRISDLMTGWGYVSLAVDSLPHAASRKPAPNGARPASPMPWARCSMPRNFPTSIRNASPWWDRRKAASW